ncbi:MAG: hypothetical protein IKF09_10570 [Clostridiales bacterium]|nr:hypothetical protein [Clostridiales bacterium]
MGHGSHHGGSFHSGGHHSSGGFGGGGFSGGGGSFGGGGFSSGGGGGFGGGGGYSGGGGGYHSTIIELVIGAIVLVFLFLKAVAEHAIPGLDLINLGMFSLSIFFYYHGIKEYDRTSVLKEFKRNYVPSPGGRVWKGRYSSFGCKGNKTTWADKYTHDYGISFFDREFGEANVKKVKETYDRTPRIVWVSSITWLIIGIISFISTFFFYESIIPFFERLIMSDEAFTFIDHFIFYLPATVTLLCSIASFAFVKVKDDILYKCAVRAVEDNMAVSEQQKTEEFIDSELSKKWYYNQCPNCGASASHALKICTHCGSSLEVRSFGNGGPGAVHRINIKDE